MLRKILLRLTIILIFLTCLISVIIYARGYRISFSEHAVVPTGILVASSTPDGASVYINGKLHGATNVNLTLSPGKYDVEIKKEGFTSWKNTLTIKGELVARTDALLFPQNPSLVPLTSLGVVKAEYFEKAGKVIIISNGHTDNSIVPSTDESQLEDMSGIYLLETSRKPLSIYGPTRLLVKRAALPADIDLSTSAFVLSPDSKEVLMKTDNPLRVYLISLDTEKQAPFVVTRSYKTIETAWNMTEAKNLQKILETFKEPIARVATDSMDIISFSPDENKILYQANKNIALPRVIEPPLVATNQTVETRDLTPGMTYVYDKKEDRNYEISNSQFLISKQTPIPKKSKKLGQLEQLGQLEINNSLLWYPDSSHLVQGGESDIAIIDYDGTHHQSVYSGPFEQAFLGVTTEGKLLVISNLNPQRNLLPDVYAVGIR